MYIDIYTIRARDHVGGKIIITLDEYRKAHNISKYRICRACNLQQTQLNAYCNNKLARVDLGVLTKDTFEFMDEYERFPYFGRYRTAFNEDDGYLYDICNIFGIAPDDLDLLYEMGYSDEEIEVMLDDERLMQQCMTEARMCMDVGF